ncbi:2OG-Fe dioxygenase family protein [Vibrio harveyi]|uniref:2OG-Fe dioxygenase family protein n=1 Tax=Vibrio harveyi TaxID=669 RepID=UPI0005183A37|nr:2OG-Fe dioxygenase family protein [Vibrio harveyi]EKO3810079.1 2OG-Fe dioxygenase family protein [Vibrio harveyi]EKO3867436.1 2OG-Fe dioxygenase family protein [Vibrio harveyi]ELI6427273.1 2OG-Fe dioxygenase family protein [Vibrio harveyi]
MMLHSRENTLHLTQLSMTAIEQLSPSFEGLPRTEHADGQYRLRRYSVVGFENGQVIDLNKNSFVQSSDINRFQGDVVRQFEPIEKGILSSDGFREMCALFVNANHLPEGQEIEIHQIRITAIYDETQVAPEGVHQDGFDHIALVGVGRHNIMGGDIMLYSSHNQAPFFRKVLENGEVAMLADSKLWHNAVPIRSVINDQEGHMDVFVLTATDKRNELQS